jgi:alkylated DNA repair protein (DNA oxidative demethylase)
LTAGLPEGLRYYPAYLDRSAQEVLADLLRKCVAEAPFFVPVMPRTGKPFSVKMTNLGSLGWVSDLKGYRYQSRHPVTGMPWPRLPESILQVWQALAHYPWSPEACLVNFYQGEARMGLHQDADEADFDAPVLSISLGYTALFRVGQTVRKGPTASFKLQSGDVLVLSGKSRLVFHGVDRIMPGTSSLLKGGGRLNLTLRRVTRPPSKAVS